MPIAWAYSREHCPRVYNICRPELGWAQTQRRIYLLRLWSYSSHYWCNGDHGGYGVLDRTYSGTGVIIDIDLIVNTTERHLFCFFHLPRCGGGWFAHTCHRHVGRWGDEREKHLRTCVRNTSRRLSISRPPPSRKGVEEFWSTHKHTQTHTNTHMNTHTILST